ncbi:MAG: hypothetical protein KF749_02855 [Bacteroidetes bacterium]|nr:hypothetical protein [Bacteroidota bacterium]MCW5896756.1 hypothetical protein [Bacteroidota bacterium]
MKQLLFLVACASFAWIGCAHESPSDVAPSDGNGTLAPLAKFVPFRAALRGSGTPPVPSPQCPGLLLTALTIQGTATHLGRLAGSQHHCLNPATGAFSNGEFEYTAANGDRLSGTYSGNLVPSADPTVFALTGSFSFTGGTGRFAHATGSGTPSGSVQVTTGDFILNLEGSISY